MFNFPIAKPIFTLLGSLYFVVACGNEPTSQTRGELRPLWVLDANRATQSVDISGVVFVSGGRSIELDDNALPSLINIPNFVVTGANTIAPNSASSMSDFAFTFEQEIRLAGGDRLQASNGNNAEQLFRREEKPIYRAVLPLDNTNSSFNLSLDYDNARFPINTTTARIFENNDLLNDQASSVLSDSGVVNFNWNVGDVSVTEGNQFRQTLLITLSSCDTVTVAEQTRAFPLIGDQRSVSLSPSDFFRPTTTAGAAIDFSANPSTCTYTLQVVAMVFPMRSMVPAALSEITPIVIVVSRTNQSTVRVNAGPEL